MTSPLAARPPVGDLPTPTDARWRPLRAGLQNVWQYDLTTRFVFHRGRLLLRGRNGAGKTKAVELLLPFLLEGRLDPRRLDPFGNQSRRMHYNLLHAGNGDLQSNVGYVWLEFGRTSDEGPRYCTIGAGLKARRTSEQVDCWFFLVHDRRVDVDLDLFDETRRPLSRPELEETLGDAGRVFEAARDYRAAVNRELFALDAQQYEALVEALLRLRQPHLSERLDPAQVGTVLSDSLSPLDAERVREVAEGFERLENHRRELTERKQTLDAVQGFLREYRGYVAAIAAVRAAALTRAERRVRDAAERATGAKAAFEQGARRHAATRERRQAVDREVGAARVRIRTIETSDEYRAVQQLEEAERHASDAGHRAAQARGRVSEGERAVREATERHDAAGQRVATQAAMVEEAALAAVRQAAAADLGDAQAAVAGQVAGARDAAGLRAARGTVTSTAKARRAAIERVRAHERAVAEAARGEQRETERLGDAEDTEREARGRAADAERSLGERTDAHRDAITTWAEGLRTHAVGAEALAAILEAPPETGAIRARAAAEPARARIDADVAASELALAEVGRRTGEVRTERDALAAATHQAPPAPPWRQADRGGRPGAPLYLLLEPTDALDASSQAGVEAGLEAAGLLDAWVTPDGRVLHPDTLDAVAVPAARAAGRTLADVTRPTPRGGVPADVVAAVASSVAVLDDDAAGAPEAAFAWVATDGRFRLGPLHGTARRETVAYLGETAREQARARRLAELDARLAALAGEADEASGRLASHRRRRRDLDAELDRFPAADAVAEARAGLVVAAQALERRAAETALRREVRAAAQERLRSAERARDAAALDARLGAHLGALDELAAATGHWEVRCGEWVAAADGWLERRAAQAEARVRDATRETETAEREALGTEERVKALRGVVGSTGDELRAELARARASERDLDAEQRRLDLELEAGARALGAQEQAHVDAQVELERVEGAREQAAVSFRGLARLQVLSYVLDVPADADPDAWGLTTTLTHARAVAKAGPTVPDGDDAVQRFLEGAQNGLAHRQQELQRTVTAGVRLMARLEQGVVLHDVQYLGKTHRLSGLVTELREDVAERETRLAKGEQELLETFLAGELHEHLRSRIRDATAIVARMNGLLEGCPTAAGQRLRLDWRVAEEAPPGTPQAVELLLRGSGLLTADHRAQLRAWLHERLRQAREGEVAASLEERIAAAFDYRKWHAFTVEFKDAAAPAWRRLTRVTHGEGSGGEKAVMLHLPLFAAMAAHYAGSKLAPRLIVLDEVFAGIDRGTRGQLMKLLVQLDLDALLTSHEEWGFYAELDGISTYHLLRDPEKPGVLAEWFVWDGGTRFDMRDRAVAS